MSKEVSTAIRTELKKTFHGVKFSVTTLYYGRVAIRWIDGPNTQMQICFYLQRQQRQPEMKLKSR
jgi:hypothetical protein